MQPKPESALKGIVAARERADRVDALIERLASAVPASVAIAALGAFGRRELTPRGDVSILFLHDGTYDARRATEAICYPLWEQSVRAEPTVRTLDEALADARRSWTASSEFLDARFVAGDPTLYDTFEHQVRLPWRRDLERLRHRLRSDTSRRHAANPAATSSTTPDLIAGRGGLLDVNALRWLGTRLHPQLANALDFLLRAIGAAEELGSPASHRLSPRLQERVAAALQYVGGVDEFAADIVTHARRVAFHLDSALAPARADRKLGPSLAIRAGRLSIDRPPPLQRAPSLGLRVANLVGLAPPEGPVLEWASTASDSLDWDVSTLEQFWLLLRAADWRAWDFLSVTGLLECYLPELRSLRHRRDLAVVEDQTLDSHSFQAVRRLHEWTDSDEPLAARLWRAQRPRDGVYLAVLLHELSPEAAGAVARRLGLADDVCASVAFAVENRRLLMDTATGRDLHDEDMVLELAGRIASPRRLGMLFLVAIAHELASTETGWRGWQADVLRQLHSRLDSALRQSGEVGARRTRSLEQHRERIRRELITRNLANLAPIVARLPRRYVLSRSPAFIARHLSLLNGAEQPELSDGEVRLRAHRHREPGLWDVLVVARDRPGLLATMAGVFSLRGVSVLAADAATTSDGLALNVFTVAGVHGALLQRDHWPAIAADVSAALEGRLPLGDLLGARPLEDEAAQAINVRIDNAASQFYSVVEVRAPDQVGLLYRIADALHELDLDIHHARIATRPDGAFDVFYVRDLSGEKLDEPVARDTAAKIAARLRGRTPPD